MTATTEHPAGAAARDDISEPTTIDEAVREAVGDVELRPDQRQAIEAVLHRDTLAVLATGTGKSLVYRVAGRLSPGLTVVVSPTLALQADQLLRSQRPLAVAINSQLTAAQQRRALARIAAGEVGFLFLARNSSVVQR